MASSDSDYSGRVLGSGYATRSSTLTLESSGAFSFHHETTIAVYSRYASATDVRRTRESGEWNLAGDHRTGTIRFAFEDGRVDERAYRARYDQDWHWNPSSLRLDGEWWRSR